MKILLAVAVLLVLFLGYVSTKEGHFVYERNGLIQTTPEKIYPLISTFVGGKMWNPYANKDPNMKVSLKGADGQVGSIMEFDGNKEAGAGSLEILKLVPNQSVQMQLRMTKPFQAENLIEYSLTPEAGGTRFSWKMSGDGGFMGKLINVFIDCEKMVTKDFVVGIENLKKIAEAQK